MSDVGGPRRPDPSERAPVEHDLDADAYEASVPSRLTGFRGTSPTALLLAGGIAIAIVLATLLTFFARSGPKPNNGTVASTSVAQPAAPGIGASGSQTPFIPEATSIPATSPTPITFIHFPTPEPTVAPVAPAPKQDISARVVAPYSIDQSTQNADDRMKIDDPKNANTSSQDEEASSDIGGGGRYVPVYKNGRVVSVVPEMSPSPSSRSSSQNTSASQPANGASNGGQFVSENRDSGLGSANSGLLEARQFSRDQQNDKVGYGRPETSRQLDTAAVINARLMSKIESDLPGPVIAQVTQPVYDSATHSVVVVPAGSRVFGTYDEETVSTSSRLLMSFTRLIFPDGEEFDIGGQPGTDAAGTAGFTGDVDKHRGSLYTSALLLTVLAGAESAISPQTQTSLTGNTSIGSQIQSAAGAELSQLGNKILNNALDRPATVIIRPPYAFQIVVTRDLPLEQYAVQQPSR